MFNNKKGEYRVQDFLPAALILLVAAIGIAIGAEVLNDVQEGYITGAAGCTSTNTTLCGTAFDVSENGLQAQDELGSWLDTIALIVAAAIIIGVLVTSFMVSNR